MTRKGRGVLLAGLTATAACAAPAEDEVSDTQNESSADGDDETDAIGTEESETRDSGGDTSAAGTGNEDTAGELGELCPDVMPGLGKLGDPCMLNAECETLVCEAFETRPATPGTCASPPPDCRSRFMGTVEDFATDVPIGGTEVAWIGSASVLNPENAEPVLSTITDAMGRFDKTSEEPFTDALGIVARVRATGYHSSLIGAIAPVDPNGVYPPLAMARDYWAIHEDDLRDWNMALMNDPDVAEHWPVEENNVIFAFVREYDYPGTRVAGAVVVPVVPEKSNLTVRYLADDGTFNADATGSSGICLLFNAGPGESVTVEVDGGVPGSAKGYQAGLSNGSLWTMALEVKSE